MIHIDLRAEARREQPEVDAPRWLYAAARQTWRDRMIEEYLAHEEFLALGAQVEAMDVLGDRGRDARSLLVAQCLRF
ncbi:MAG: hypothetical protein AAGA56_13740, partial [Myxococcota bacterium]